MLKYIQILLLLGIFMTGVAVGVFGIVTVWIPGVGMVHSSNGAGACLKAVELYKDAR